MEIIDYYNEEIEILERRYHAYTEYGYSPMLSPIVDTLKEAIDKLKAARKEYERD